MAEKQFGGWYPNPEQGGKVMRYWGGSTWTTGSDPTGGAGPSWNAQPAQTQVSTPGYSAPQVQQAQPQGAVGDYASLLQRFPGYAGWGQSEALADYRATGGSGKGGITSTSTPSIASSALGQVGQAPQVNWQDLIQQAIGLSQQTIQPQVQALEAQKPLEQTKYENLLKDITNLTTRSTAQEFSRRGIPLQSGVYEQELARATEPQVAQAAMTREQNLANIASQIAQLQSGALSGGLSTGLNLYGTQMGAEQSAAQRALESYGLQKQLEQAAAEQAFKQQVYQETTLPESKVAIQKSQSGAAEDDLSWLKNLFGLGIGNNTLQSITPTEPKPQYSPMNMKIGTLSQNGQWAFTGEAPPNDWVPVVD